MVWHILHPSVFVFRYIDWSNSWEICLIDKNFLKNAKIVVGLWLTAISAGMAIGGYMAKFEVVEGKVTDHEMRIRNLESGAVTKTFTYIGDSNCRDKLAKCGQSLNQFAHFHIKNRRVNM
jgi:hypothetical protein